MTELPDELILAAWARVMPSVEQRIMTLLAFADSLVAGPPAPSDVEVARTEAHRLAGSLGSYGLPEGTARAREIESLLGEMPLDALAIRGAAVALAHIVSLGPS